MPSIVRSWRFGGFKRYGTLFKEHKPNGDTGVETGNYNHLEAFNREVYKIWWENKRGTLMTYSIY